MNLKSLAIIGLFTISACVSYASGAKTQKSADYTSDKSWIEYNQILSKASTALEYSGPDGIFNHTAVNYKMIANNKLLADLFAQQASKLKAKRPPENKKDKLTFWINAYNFFTLHEVKNNYPTKSMKKIGWKNNVHNVGGKLYSLDTIEHKILRPLQEPKIHFAINCASVGCPSLRRTAFTTKTLDKELNEVMENALKNPMHIRVADGFFGGEKLLTTKLFSWFDEDFEVKPYGEIINFIHAYAPKRIKSFDDYSTGISYDWNLNNEVNIQTHMKELAKKEPKLQLKPLKN